MPRCEGAARGIDPAAAAVAPSDPAAGVAVVMVRNVAAGETRTRQDAAGRIAAGGARPTAAAVSAAAGAGPQEAGSDHAGVVPRHYVRHLGVRAWQCRGYGARMCCALVCGTSAACCGVSSGSVGAVEVAAAVALVGIVSRRGECRGVGTARFTTAVLLGCMSAIHVVPLLLSLLLLLTKPGRCPRAGDAAEVDVPKPAVGILLLLWEGLLLLHWLRRLLRQLLQSLPGPCLQLRLLL